MWAFLVAFAKVIFCLIVVDGIGEIVSMLKEIRNELRRLDRD